MHGLKIIGQDAPGADGHKENSLMDRDNRIEKKSWSKPELLVLVRSNPEETVLVNCKQHLTPVFIKNKPTCADSGCKSTKFS
jgi:hypothetical protein